MDRLKATVAALYLFNQSNYHKWYSLLDFNTFAVYPILANKARVFYDDNDKPIGFVSWCFLTKQEAEDFLNEELQLTEEIYFRDSGEELWGIEFIAPYGHTRQVMREMRKISDQQYGPDKTVNWRRLSNATKRHKGNM